MANGTNHSGYQLPVGSPRGTNFRTYIVRRIKAVARHLLPASFINEARRCQAYDSRERALYLKIRAMNAIGIQNPRSSQPPRTAHSFLFVCFGNIMRSPMCEALMRRAVASNPQIRVTSAGLHAIPGRIAEPRALLAAMEFGISLENHRARLLSAEMVRETDVIFAMDYQNQVQLLSRYPEARDKIFMLAAYADKPYRSVEIGDPYYMGEDATRSCYAILNTCIQNLASSLSDQ